MSDRLLRPVLPPPTNKDGKPQKRFNSKKASQSLMDYDYLDKLSPEEREWLGKFNREYYLNQFDRTKKNLHHTKRLKLEVYDNDRARRRVIDAGYTFPVPSSESFGTPSPEDAIIEVLDEAKNKKKR